VSVCVCVCTVLYSTVLYCTVQNCTVQYSTVQGVSLPMARGKLEVRCDNGRWPGKNVLRVLAMVLYVFAMVFIQGEKLPLLVNIGRLTAGSCLFGTGIDCSDGITRVFLDPPPRLCLRGGGGGNNPQEVGNRAAVLSAHVCQPEWSASRIRSRLTRHLPGFRMSLRSVQRVIKEKEITVTTHGSPTVITDWHSRYITRLLRGTPPSKPWLPRRHRHSMYQVLHKLRTCFLCPSGRGRFRVILGF